jgi:hypothetical protein
MGLAAEFCNASLADFRPCIARSGGAGKQAHPRSMAGVRATIRGKRRVFDAGECREGVLSSTAETVNLHLESAL